MTRKNLLALGSIYIVLSAVLVVTWVASSVLFVLILALILAAGGIAALVAGFRKPASTPIAGAAGVRTPVPGVAEPSRLRPMPSAVTPPQQVTPAPGPDRPFDMSARVRFAPDVLATTKTQGHEVLLRGHTGSVIGFVGSDAVEVRWDAGPYEEYVDLVPTASGLRATAGDTLTLEAFDAAVNQDNLHPADDVSEAPPPPTVTVEATATTPVPGPGRCASCGREVLTTGQFVDMAARHGYVVDPLTGDASIGPGQAIYDALEESRGYACDACGQSHCTGCLMRTPPHPVTHGPRCPSCGEGPHAPLDD